MTNKSRLIGASTLLFVLATLAACGGGSGAGGGSGVASNTYTSTTSRGDLVNYTLAGSAATIQWHVTDNLGTINYTWNLAATCGAVDATYGNRTCTINTSTCVVGAVACPATSPSGTIDLIEVPGTAMVGKIPAATALLINGSNRGELHAGFISGGCPTDVTGDYAYIMTGGPSASNSGTELFGVYRSDATFNSVTHADFGMRTVGASALSTAVASYETGSPAGIETFTGATCLNGVFTRADGAKTLRLNITSGGSLILDFPADEGGLISFKTTSAATLADLANRNWWGIDFPNNDGSGSTPVPEFLSLTTTAVVGGAVTVSGGTPTQLIVPTPIKPATGGAALTPAAKLAAPAAYTASLNALLATYAAPSDIPGLFLIDQAPTANIVAVSYKVGTQVMLYGVGFHFLDAAGVACVAGSSPACIPRNNGNFIAFTR